MKKDEQIRLLLSNDLKSEDSKEKYLNILDKRLDENRKSLSNLFIVLIISILAFHLLLETKISEINLGPLKIVDNKIAISLIPTIFTIVYYKYLMVWFDMIEQKRVYKLLTLQIFKFKNKSYLNDRISPFSITDSIDKHYSSEQKNVFGCLTYLLLLPTVFLIMVFPFAYEYYLINKLFKILTFTTKFEWFLFISPVIICGYTILMAIKAIQKDIKKTNEKAYI